MDAALGLVDSVDVLSNGAASATGSALLYHRLVGAGHRLAVTAGTDVFLSFSHSSTFSNPPGFAHVYVQVEGPAHGRVVSRPPSGAVAPSLPTVRGLSSRSRATSAGATSSAGGDKHVATARVDGPGVDRLALMTADGKLAEVPSQAGTGVGYRLFCQRVARRGLWP